MNHAAIDEGCARRWLAEISARAGLYRQTYSAAGGGSSGPAGGPAATGAAGVGAKKGALSNADEAFMSRAAQNGYAEIEASKMAMEN